MLIEAKRSTAVATRGIAAVQWKEADGYKANSERCGYILVRTDAECSVNKHWDQWSVNA